MRGIKVTNSSPPEPPSPRRSTLRRDEIIAVVVAFASIGSILYWGINQKDSGWKFNLGQSLLTSPETETQPSTSTAELEGSLAGSGLMGGKLKQPVTIIGESEDDYILSPLSPRDAEIAGRDRDIRDGYYPLDGGVASLPRYGWVPGQKRPSDGEDATQGSAVPPEDKASPAPDTQASPTPDTQASPTPDTQASPTPDTQASPAPAPAIPIPVPVEGGASPTPDTQASPAPVAEFKDVPEQYWAEPFIAGLATKKILSGFPGTTNFQPDKPVTRAELAAQIRSAFNREERGDTASFPDVPSGYWASESIDEAVKTGFMKGYAEGQFRPDQEVPRVQVLVALVTGLNLQPKAAPEETLKKFQDSAQIPEWAKAKIAAATEAGLVVNYPDKKVLNPNQPATRAEVAAMLYQALANTGEVEASSSEYVVRP